WKPRGFCTLHPVPRTLIERRVEHRAVLPDDRVGLAEGLEESDARLPRAVVLVAPVALDDVDEAVERGVYVAGAEGAEGSGVGVADGRLGEVVGVPAEEHGEGADAL